MDLFQKNCPKCFQSTIMIETGHCVKSVWIWIYFWSVFSHIWIEYRKLWTRKYSVSGHFSRSGNRRFLQIGEYCFKIFYKKQKPKISHYGNCKTFDAIMFHEELNDKLLNIDTNNTKSAEFTDTVLSVLYKCKQKGAHKRKIYSCKQFSVHGKRSKSSNNEDV